MRLFAQHPVSEPVTSDALQVLAARGLSDAGGSKPLLLRVLTDLYVMRASHTPEETHQFSEIALRLLPDATQAECDHAANVLCHHPAAPPELLERLAARGGDGALKLFGQCRALSTKILQGAAAGAELVIAEALAN